MLRDRARGITLHITHCDIEISTRRQIDVVGARGRNSDQLELRQLNQHFTGENHFIGDNNIGR
ncbi:Uncharacterised protein [Vibrio cholerae]|nr:Uncharacterised protein [Vibrio cholerae]